MNCRFLALVLFLFLSIISFSQGLENNRYLENASVSYLVIDAENGDTLMSYRPYESMTPASVLKIIPTSSALDKFGEERVFTTRILYRGTINNGVLVGDIYIVGGGDPALGSIRFQDHYYKPISFLQQWINDIRSAGIRKIEGNIYGVENQDLMNKVPRTWIWEDLANHFGASPGALNIYDNLFHISFNTKGAIGSKAKLTSYYPNFIKYSIENQVRIADGGGDQAYVFGSPDSNVRLVKGTLPQGYSKFAVKASIANPAKLIAGVFKKHLTDAGIHVTGIAEMKSLTDSLKPLSSFDSPNLGELAKTTNHRSINLYANMIGSLFSETLDMEDASEKIIEYWTSKGLDTKGLFLDDLCGLSPFDQVSAYQIAFILKYMRYSENFNVFFESLPVSGKSGTLKYFGHSKSYNGKFHGKSGSIKRVYSYAGYMTCASGKQVIIVAMTNKFSCKSKQAKAVLADFFDYVHDNN